MYKNKKIILAVLVGLFIFIGLGLLARPTSTDKKANLKETADTGIVADKKDHDFGTISMAAGVVTHTFKISNPTGQPVEFTKLYTSCMCTSATLITLGGKYGPMGMPGHGSIPRFKAVLEPGNEAEIEVSFDPAAHGPAGVGRIERMVFLENNDQNILELGFSAFVTP